MKHLSTQLAAPYPYSPGKLILMCSKFTLLLLMKKKKNHLSDNICNLLNYFKKVLD